MRPLSGQGFNKSCATSHLIVLSRSEPIGTPSHSTAGAWGEKVLQRITRYQVATVATFGQELFEYITTIVPRWRVCDEAWPLVGGHLTGIGVLRNYGGQVMVLPWTENARRQLAHFHDLIAPLSERIVVVVDDRDLEDVESTSAMLSPITVLPWSRRTELAKFVIKDNPD